MPVFALADYPTAEAAARALLVCGPREPHRWTYRGADKGYRCVVCLLEVSKAHMKQFTD